MFRLKQSDTFTWPVEVQVPTDGGRFEKQTFDATFKRRTASELQALQAREGITDVEMVRELMVGWSGITDDGGEVPFSDGALAQLLEIPGVPGAIGQAYYGALAGLKRKN